ncbi:hypothetical protein [Vibrio parahaemolyticus]|uniref:hypothetical protein n=1 Tax=Vibrio parahaemolyticus TaxID=670 RepID=UPI00387B1FFD
MIRLLLLTLFLVGCTTVKIIDKDGSVSVIREFGVVNISATPTDGSVYTDISVFGYASTPLGQVIGYSNQSIAVMSEKCKLIIWLNGLTEPSLVNELLREGESICIFDSNQQKEK